MYIMYSMYMDENPYNNSTMATTSNPLVKKIMQEVDKINQETIKQGKIVAQQLPSKVTVRYKPYLYILAGWSPFGRQM